MVFLAVTTISFKSTFEAIESVFCAIRFTDNNKSNIKIALLFISLINVVYNCRFKVEFLGFIFANIYAINEVMGTYPHANRKFFTCKAFCVFI